MLELNKKQVSDKMQMNTKVYNSVCNSCSCSTGGSNSCNCNSTCKGCKDKGYSVAQAKKAYNR